MSKKIIAVSLLISIFFERCQNSELILTKDERTIIDTTSSSQISKLSKDFDTWCKDSTPVIRQKFIDSLLTVRQIEINKRLGR
jgi:hypothetical protein